MKKYIFAMLVLLAAGALNAPAQSTPLSLAGTITWFVEPQLSKGFGGSAYDLSVDAGGGDKVLSRLEFPVVPIEAGIRAGATIEREGTRRWLFELGFAHSIIPMGGVMKDYDWYQYAGYPPTVWSYTESDDSTVSWNLSAEAAWTFAAVGPVTLALYLQYRYQTARHVEDGVNGWQYQWTSGPSYDLYVIDDSRKDVLEYSLSAHMPGLGFLADLQVVQGLDLELRACYMPVFVFDRDDHVLRSKLSTAEGWGSGVYANLRARYTFQKLRSGITPYLALDGRVLSYVVDTTQTQYWYGGLDSVPQGTKYTGIGHVISSTEYQVGLTMGFAF